MLTHAPARLPADATKLHPPLANLEVKAFKIKPTTIPPDPALLINDTTTTTTANKDKQEVRRGWDHGPCHVSLTGHTPQCVLLVPLIHSPTHSDARHMYTLSFPA